MEDHSLPQRKAVTTRGYILNSVEDSRDSGKLESWGGHIDANWRPW